jgi:hypothetical protein
MRTRVVLTTAAAAALLSFSDVTVAGADDDHRRPQNIFTAGRMRPSNETPICSATGTGSTRIEIAEDEQSLTFEVSYDLEGTVTVAHVHLGQAFVAGGVSFFFCGGGGKPACDPSPATITGTVVPADILGPVGQGVAAGEFAEVVRAIRAGDAYSNVHSNICPGGEVRGQLRHDPRRH